MLYTGRMQIIALGHYSTHTYGPAHKPQADFTTEIYTPQQRCNTNALVYYKNGNMAPDTGLKGHMWTEFRKRHGTWRQDDTLT